MIPARYHNIRNRTLAAVDRRLAEPVKFWFFKDAIRDPDRPEVEIEAILRVKESVTSSLGGRNSGSWQTRISASKSVLFVDRVRYPDLVIHSRDKLCALSRPNQPVFEVATVNYRGSTRLIIGLNEA